VPPHADNLHTGRTLRPNLTADAIAPAPRKPIFPSVPHPWSL
jgi:hypothetical protein